MDSNKCLTDPIGTNEKPPMCFLGCCNVRSWALFVSLLNIIFLMIQVFNIFKTNEKLTMVTYYAILYIALIILNVELGRGVLRRNIVPILNWLRFYTIGLILTNVLLTVALIIIVNDDDPFTYNASKLIKENASSLILSILSLDAIFIIVHYPVYQYYKFQKSCSQQTFMSEKHQTV